MEGKRTAAEERASYREGYEKDAAAWKSRIAELEAAGVNSGAVYDSAKAALANAERHLKTYTDDKAAAKK